MRLIIVKDKNAIADLLSKIIIKLVKDKPDVLMLSWV